MRNLFKAFLIFGIVYSTSSCSNQSETENLTEIENPTIENEAFSKQDSVVVEEIKSDTEFKELLGIYKGEMGGKLLTIEITSIVNGIVDGFNVLANNKRPLKGRVTETNERADGPDYFKGFDVVLNEPGDDKWDGVFKLEFDSYADSDSEEGDRTVYSDTEYSFEINGTWKANNGKLNRDFKLKKQ
jgi:hypothetical protein